MANTDDENAQDGAGGTDNGRGLPADEELIPQPHGGALRKPWTRSTNPRGSFRAARKECLALLADATPVAAARLIDLSMCSDPRAAVVATGMIMDRVLGKATDKPPADEDTAGGLSIDPKYLTPEERRAMSEHLAGLAGLMAIARQRAAEAND